MVLDGSVSSSRWSREGDQLCQPLVLDSGQTVLRHQKIVASWRFHPETVPTVPSGKVVHSQDISRSFVEAQKNA